MRKYKKKKKKKYVQSNGRVGGRVNVYMFNNNDINARVDVNYLIFIIDGTKAKSNGPGYVCDWLTTTAALNIKRNHLICVVNGDEYQLVSAN